MRGVGPNQIQCRWTSEGHPDERFTLKMELDETTLPSWLGERLKIVWQHLQIWSDERTLSSLLDQGTTITNADHFLIISYQDSCCLCRVSYGSCEIVGWHENTSISTRMGLGGWELINKSRYCLYRPWPTTANAALRSFALRTPPACP